MIVGVGVDVVRIERIDERIAERILTEDEMRISRSIEFIAGRFALKEAFFKAIGTGLRGFSFKDVEFLKDELGKPVLRIGRDFPVVFNFAHVSLSHDFVAVGLVILERLKGGIFVKGKPKDFEILREVENGIYEIDSPYGPFKTKEILKKQGVDLVRYGNLEIFG